MNISFDYYSISLLLGGFTALLSGVIVFLHDQRRLENQAWFWLNLSSAVWSFGYFAMVAVVTSKDIAMLSDSILHIAASCIPLFYFLMVLAVTGRYERHRNFLFTMVAAGVFFMLVAPTSYFVRDVFAKGPFRYVPDPGPLYAYFTVYFFAIVLYALWIVSRRLKETYEPAERGRLWSIMIFTIAGFGGGGSVFLLTFNIGIPPYPLILFSLYPVISGYAIFRYQLFDTKVITTELLTFSLWIFILIRALLATTPREQVMDGLLLFLTVIFGIFLIGSVMREVEIREKIQKLAENLEHANDRLKELDRLKSEFVSFATHQIRGPLTSIKGYASLMIEGDYGAVPDNIKEPIHIIFQSSQAMATIVEDFLNVSRIEQGRMKYEWSVFDLRELVNQAVTEAKPAVERKGLTISVSLGSAPLVVRADKGKIKQVIGNLLDNAVKYTPKGGITVTLVGEQGKARLSINDTGVGIRSETIPHLFQKFSRAEDASKVNILGTGLGLYVAKEMIKAHTGKVWVESPGEGKGSTFFVELATGQNLHELDSSEKSDKITPGTSKPQNP